VKHTFQYGVHSLYCNFK